MYVPYYIIFGLWVDIIFSKLSIYIKLYVLIIFLPKNVKFQNILNMYISNSKLFQY